MVMFTSIIGDLLSSDGAAGRPRSLVEGNVRNRRLSVERITRPPAWGLRSLTMPDHADPASVAAALNAWLVEEFGADARLADEVIANGDGFDAAIFFVRFAGEDLPAAWREPLVLRVKPSVDALDVAQREAAIQEWAADRSYPTPRVLRVFGPGDLLARPAQIMERVPGRMVLAELQSRPWRVRRLLRRMATLHVALHSLDPSDFPAGPDLLDNRLALTRETAEALDHEGLRRGLERIEPLLPRLRDAPAAVCHGDFHPLNVIVADDSMAVIDWTDAGVGDPAGDVARTLALLSIAHLAGSNRIERTLLRAVGPMLARMYRSAYGAQAPIDMARVGLWVPVHLLHGWSQTVGATAGMFDETEDDDVGARLPDGLADELERRFDAALDDASS